MGGFSEHAKREYMAWGELEHLLIVSMVVDMQQQWGRTVPTIPGPSSVSRVKYRHSCRVIVKDGLISHQM